MSLLTDQSTANTVTHSNRGNDMLSEFLKDPLNLFYRFYQSSLVSPENTESIQVQPLLSKTTEKDENSSENSQKEASFQRRLHLRAESCRSSLMAGTASVVLKRTQGDDDSNGLNLLIQDLPVTVLLHIATFLDPKSLCHLQQTNKHFHSLMSDELLWRRKLVEDSRKWQVMSHLSHPRVYEETATDKTAQEIYGSCYQNRDTSPSQNYSNPVTHTLRYIMRRIQGRVPRLLMFGSGLESIPLIRLMIMENKSPYQPIGLFPGKDGVGAGICVKHKETSVNLVTLYTATKAERTAAPDGKVKRVNKLISAYNEEDNNAPELTRSVQEQCQLADGFILIVNASHLNEQELKLDITMINAMLLSGSPRNALLVLSCYVDDANTSFTTVTTNDTQRTSSTTNDSSLEIADKLKLCDISCPWQVRNMNVSTFEGLSDGFDWLLAATDNN